MKILARSLRIFLFLLILLVFRAQSWAQITEFSSWWLPDAFQISPTNCYDDYAVATAGQLKYLATLAKKHVELNFQITKADWDMAYLGAGNNPFPFSEIREPSNRSPILIGQLKNVSAGFYRLFKAKNIQIYVANRAQSLGIETSNVDGVIFPWRSDQKNNDNNSIATVGQLKTVFSFDFAPRTSYSREDLGAGFAPYLRQVCSQAEGTQTLFDLAYKNDVVASVWRSNLETGRYKLNNIGYGFPVSFSNISVEPEGVANVSENGEISHISGTSLAPIIVKCVAHIGKHFPISVNYSTDLSFSTTSTDTKYIFVGHRVGSLAEHCKKQIDRILEGYSSQNERNNQIRHFQFWTSPSKFDDPSQNEISINVNNILVKNNIDISCIPVATSGQGNPGCLVTPRHIITAAHLNPTAGIQYTFIKSDHSLVKRNVTRVVSGGIGDLAILTLDSDLPTSIIPAKVMPRNSVHYMPLLYAGNGVRVSNADSTLIGELIPCISLHNPYPPYDETSATISVNFCASDGTRNPDGTIFFRPPNSYGNYLNGVRESEYYTRTAVGDSGHPSFLVINQSLVLLCTFHTGSTGPETGTSIQANLDLINNSIRTDGNYSLCETDLSGQFTYF